MEKNQKQKISWHCPFKSGLEEYISTIYGSVWRKMNMWDRLKCSVINGEMPRGWKPDEKRWRLAFFVLFKSEQKWDMNTHSVNNTERLVTAFTGDTAVHLFASTSSSRKRKLRFRAFGTVFWIRPLIFYLSIVRLEDSSLLSKNLSLSYCLAPMFESLKSQVMTHWPMYILTKSYLHFSIMP